MPTIAHIINPVKVSETSDLFAAQPITFESMKRAKNFAQDSKNITLLSIQYEEDREIVPDYFQILPNLERSVLDSNSKLLDRKLPLIADIIMSAVKNSAAEYIIYTNADIGLMPHFYDFVLEQISEGHDALVINRRRVPAHLNKMADLPKIYSSLGKSHPGFDCFVFQRSLFHQMELASICVGIPFIGVSMAHNLFCLAKNPGYYPDAHLTFHIGESVDHSYRNAFYKHNRHEFEQVVFPALKEKFDISKFPYAGLPLYERALKWMLNPSLFTKNFLDSEQKGLTKKLDEIRWRILNR